MTDDERRFGTDCPYASDKMQVASTHCSWHPNDRVARLQTNAVLIHKWEPQYHIWVSIMLSAAAGG